MRYPAKFLGTPIQLQFNPTAVHVEPHALPLAKPQIPPRDQCEYQGTASELTGVVAGLRRASPALPRAAHMLSVLPDSSASASLLFPQQPHPGLTKSNRIHKHGTSLILPKAASPADVPAHTSRRH